MDARQGGRNGYRERDWDARVVSIELVLPKLRAGSYFPDWLIEPRRRAEQAFASVIADAYLPGLAPGPLAGRDRRAVPQPAARLRALSPYLVLDALEVKCREGGRTVNACVVHAVAVNRAGYRESLGLDVVTSEDGAAWLAFLRSLVARGLKGVRLVTSDAHPGLVDAIASSSGRTTRSSASTRRSAVIVASVEAKPLQV